MADGAQVGAEVGAEVGGSGRRDVAALSDALGPFARWVGLELVEADGDHVVATWTARADLHQPYGIVHGGVHCSVVETLASIGAALWMGERGQVVGVSNTTDFLRAVREGELRGEATPVHRGRLQQLWQVQITDAEDRLVARGQVRLQNIANDHLTR